MPHELETAFDAALAQIERLLATEMKTMDGTPALPHLEKLEKELKRERVDALGRGSVDREWFQKTVRWLVEWVPEDDVTLVAALGRIVRAVPPAV
jgi:hypothetical protein